MEIAKNRIRTSAGDFDDDRQWELPDWETPLLLTQDNYAKVVENYRRIAAVFAHWGTPLDFALPTYERIWWQEWGVHQAEPASLRALVGQYAVLLRIDRPDSPSEGQAAIAVFACKGSNALLNLLKTKTQPLAELLSRLLETPILVTWEDSPQSK